MRIDWSEQLFDETVDWVSRNCISADQLGSEVGVNDRLLTRMFEIGLVPEPTYEVTRSGVRSPIAELGTIEGERSIFYGGAVVTWLRRCAAYVEANGAVLAVPALRDWLSEDLATALEANAPAARQYGWSHLFNRRGGIDERALDEAAAMLWQQWLGGGWAVCLNCFDGHHVVTKNVELARIPSFAAASAADPAAVTDLIDAMIRYDSVATPFSPFERGISSRGRAIDGVAAKLEIPWPRSDGARLSKLAA